MSKRQLWKIINNAKEGRAIVLTTHSMEEAEILCSRIGIVAHGQLKCLGSPLHLKNKFADGYKLNVNFDKKDQQVVDEGMKKLFPGIREVASFTGTKEYRVQIPHGQVSEVFALMESRSAEYKINDWSISQVF